MCGIAGCVEVANSVAEDRIRAQLTLLEHRGPDSLGVYARGRGAVGQTRLAVIDLRTGDPPITNENGTVGVALNGELYNFVELRRALQSEGHSFRTSGDTEVLAHLFEARTVVEAVRQLDGMFAFAAWDSHREVLILGRDRVGKKPVYYWAAGGRLVFASEIKALLAGPSVPRNLDSSAIPAYLTFGYVPTPRTFYGGIRSLPPGHVLVMRPGGLPRLLRYWDPPRPRPYSRRPEAPGQPTLDRAAKEVQARLRDAVRRRLTADVPLGAFLSGGIDSTAIVALASQFVDTRSLKTFTIGFDDRDGYDERAYARFAAEHYHTDHHEFVVKPHAVELVERLVWHYDQPFGDSSAIPTYLLSGLTGREVTVALAGDGGDELFAGYERFAAALTVGHYLSLPEPARRLLRALAKHLPSRLVCGRKASVMRFLSQAERGLPNAYLGWLSYVDEALRCELLDAHGSPADHNWALEDYQRIWGGSKGLASVDRLLDLNLRTYLLDDLLVKVDRMSMAHGLEVRSPFLDTALLEYAWGLPGSMKVRGLTLKRVLKRAVADLVPQHIIRRRKRGFGVPLDRWFRTDLSAYLTSMIGSSSARVRQHLAPAVVDRLLRDHSSGHADHGQTLWALLTLEVFLRREGW